MPIDYEIRPEAIWFRTDGDVDYEQGLSVLEAGIAAARQQARGKRRPVVFDITASAERRSADELRAIAHFVGENRVVLEPRCAVVTGDDLRYGLARMFEAFAGEHDVRVSVFRDAGERSDWLAAGEPG
jgi:hypothetical protein